METKKNMKAENTHVKKQKKNEKPPAQSKQNVQSNEQPTMNKESSENRELTEKEKRKLEWEKKLASQKPAATDLKTVSKTLSKSELKAQRRELQEAQRQAKMQQPEVKTPAPQKAPSEVATKPTPVSSTKATPLRKTTRKSKVSKLEHLYQTSSKSHEQDRLATVHPAFVQMASQHRSKNVLGSNARCISLLDALETLINDLKSPPEQEYCRYLESELKNCTEYLEKYRPMSVSMKNVLRSFKLQLSQIDSNLPDEEKKQRLTNFVSVYINDEILTAGQGISQRVTEKISDGDTILTYSCSSLITRILVETKNEGKNFKVIVVDNGPLFEGLEMTKRLQKAGIKTIYSEINSLNYVMDSVNKVLLGAHSLLNNGYVMSRTGTAQVALVAAAFNKPVLICCETYKFSERVQTDAIVKNEIGDCEKLLVKEPITEKVANMDILYDVTPSELVTAVVTELAVLPCTSVPVVLRINLKEV